MKHIKLYETIWIIYSTAITTLIVNDCVLGMIRTYTRPSTLLITWVVVNVVALAMGVLFGIDANINKKERDKTNEGNEF